MEDERRNANRRQDVANVDLGVHTRQRERRAGARAHPQVGRPPRPKRRIRSHRRRALLDADRAAPLVADPRVEGLPGFVCRSPRILRIPEPLGIGPNHHERAGFLRIRRSKERAHRAAFGHADERRVVRSNLLHHRPDVVHPLLECRELRDAIGKARAALVDQDQAGERRQAEQKAREGWLGPEVLEVRDPAHDEDEIARTAADDLVGDVDIAAARVVRLGHRHQRRRRTGWHDGKPGSGRCGRVDRHRGDESVAPAMRGLDVGRRPRIVV